MNIAYYRVSTARQGRSGLGLDAQRAAVRAYLGGEPDMERQDIESGSHNDRPGLAAALRECRLTGARLVIAKLDRLSRNASFLLALRDSRVDFVCCDMPDANRLTIGIMALMAEHEREMISKRTRDALQAAKARGQRLGNPNGARALQTGQARAANRAALAAKASEHAREIVPIVQDLQSAGIRTLAGLAAELNARGIRTPRGRRWHASSVSNMLNRKKT